MRVKNIIKLIKTNIGHYEESDKENNRLIFGKEENEVKRIYFCWMLTLDILKKLILDKNTLIICHEPVVYNVKYSMIPKIDDYIIRSNKEKLNLIFSSGVNIARFHLSLDSSPYGTNATLIKKMGLIELKKFDYFSICEISKSEIAIDFIKRIKDTLNAPFIDVVGNINKIIKRVLVAAGGGANKEFLSFALANDCDAIISGDSYMESRYLAYENGILLIDPGHQYLEIPGIKYFAEVIKKHIKNKNIKISFIENKRIDNIC